jgi:hypothetical protein
MNKFWNTDLGYSIFGHFFCPFLEKSNNFPQIFMIFLIKKLYHSLKGNWILKENINKFQIIQLLSAALPNKKPV